MSARHRDSSTFGLQTLAHVLASHQQSHQASTRKGMLKFGGFLLSKRAT